MNADLPHSNLDTLDEALILVGAAIMLIAIFKGYNIIGLVNKKYQKYWQVLFGFMIFFFVGYICSFFVVHFGTGKIFIREVVSIIFFFGSLYVYIVVRIGYYTIKDMELSIEELQDNVNNRKELETKLSASRDKLAKQNVALNYLTRNILGKNTIEDSIKQVSEKASEILDVQRVSIWLFDKARTHIYCIDLYERELNQHTKGEKLYIKDYPVYFKSLEKDGIIDAYDVLADERTKEFSESYFIPNKIVSLLDMPIYMEGKLEGIICSEQKHEKRMWAIEEQSFTSSVADIIAVTFETFERRKTEEELELSLSLMTATIESTADGILVVDKAGKLSGFNQQFLKMWRIPQSIMDKRHDEEALGYVISQLKYPEQFLDKVKELYANPDMESFDILEFKDGRVFERFSKPQRTKNEIIGRVWSFRDITQRKKSEEEIRKLNADLENRVRQRTQEVNELNAELKINIQNLELANKELESFSYSVSHDLRAPLRAINGFISILEQKYPKAADGDTKKYMEIISANAKKMGQLIDDLLAFSRLGKKELVKTKVDINELVKEILDEMNIKEWNENSKVITSDLLPIVGDRNLLKQAFYNLISNALKYSHTRPEPTVEIRSYSENKDNVYVVKDNGVGFSMEYYDKLFKVFQRLHSTEEFEGVGVGLAIVFRIVSRHGGRVWAESKENEGAAFYMAFPTNGSQNTTKNTGQSASPAQ